MINIFWTGYSNDERHKAIIEIQTLVSRFGEIVDFKFFSYLSLSMTIEIKEIKLDKLYGNLCKILGMTEFESLNSNSETERTLYLNITFAKGTGSLRNEVIAIPS